MLHVLAPKVNGTKRQKSNKDMTPKRQKTKNKELSTPTMSVDLLTPTSRHTSRCSPLPNFSWADAREVWDLMINKDTVYTRNALMLHRHPSLQARMRSILMDWLSEVCEVYRLNRDTYYLCIDFIDRYLSYQSEVPKQQLQLIGITCLFIAAKVEEIYPPKMSEFAYVTDGACIEPEITTKELVILKSLKWDLCPMTANNWLTVYMQLYAIHEKENSLRRDGDAFLIPEYQSKLFAQIAHLVDLCILDIGSLTYQYSIIAAAALYHFTSEEVVFQCTAIKMQDMRDCVIWMIPFALAVKEDGFENPKLLQQTKSDDSQPFNYIQCHSVDLQLLEKAHLKQSQTKCEYLDDSESLSSSSSSVSSPVATRTRRSTILTPPRSSSKRC
ncbi:G1/S-specific cyclin-E1-like [Oppia nitens]|uniref:G1/S-specific cyclin-E1-like n=1 Tax=Oppia nitens TaxID=1686743 RepID=UPI0023DB1D13|nr:G1/S-specific cyclin-E1-like [Oppia nitens]XP_054164976.1 G1/S-specific cyclin-E1-like [Oppia nitens]